MKKRKTPALRAIAIVIPFLEEMRFRAWRFWPIDHRVLGSPKGAKEPFLSMPISFKARDPQPTNNNMGLHMDTKCRTADRDCYSREYDTQRCLARLPGYRHECHHTGVDPRQTKDVDIKNELCGIWADSPMLTAIYGSSVCDLLRAFIFNRACIYIQFQE